MIREVGRVGARYGLAVLAVVAAFAVVQIPAVLEGAGASIALVAILAVLIAARWGGIGPGLVATGLITLGTILWYPRSYLPVRYALFISCGTMVSLLVGSLRAARHRAEGDAEGLRRSERRIAELNADLRRRVSELRTILEVIPMGIGIAEDPECRMIRANGEFARLLGLPPNSNASLSAPAGERPRNFRVYREGREVSPEELPLQRAARDGVEVRELEIDVVHDDGRVVTLLESAAPLRDEDDAIRGSVGAFLDITELKRAREELRRAKEAAEAAVGAKDLFLAMLSHELRTPLTPASLVIAALLADPDTPAAIREELEVVGHGLATEARLLEDLLDASRAAAGKLRVIPQPIDAHAAIHRALAACRDDIEEAGIHLVVEAPDPGPIVVADPVRVQQVIWNLVKNACKFTPPHGSVTVRTRLRSGVPGEPDRLRVEVVDTGVGMDPELLERAFRPFEQGVEGLRRTGGLGLGLAIARSIAEAHGGRLYAASDGPGRGTTFTLELPLAPEAIEPVPTHPRRRFDPTRHRLLVVEDDPASARVLDRLLRRRGADVSSAGSLAEARALVASCEPFDLIITDLTLPDGNGLELIRLLDGVPAIALSGSLSGEEDLLVREAGAVIYLAKPVDLGILENAIDRALTPVVPA
jgi:PAS domain S-box-containing protein